MEYKIFTPTLTIFDANNKISIEGNKKYIEYLIEAGVDGLVPLGSTGEFTGLSLEEKKELIKLYVDTVKNRVKLMIGANSINPDECIEIANYSFKLGVDGVLILPPFYYAIDQKEAFLYYDYLAKNIGGNIYIYNIKDRTGFDISPETTLRLVKTHDNIVGMKDTTDSINHTKAVLDKVLAVRPDFEMFSGFDNHFISNINSGGVGCISALSNLEPKLWVSWVKSARENDFEKLFKINKKIDDLMPLYDICSNFSLLFKLLLNDSDLDIPTNSITPFNQISDVQLNTARRIRNSIQ